MALRDINLVPDAVIRRQHLVRHGVVWAFAYVALLAVVAGAALGIQRHIAVGHSVSLNQEDLRKQLAATVAEIDTRRERIEKLSLVRQLSHPIGKAEVIVQLAETMDGGTWLTKLSLHSDAPGAARMTLEGLTVSNARLGSMLQMLSAHAYFKDVVLRQSSGARQLPDTEGIPGELVEFSIDARVSVR